LDLDITISLGEAGRQAGFEAPMQAVVAALEALRDVADEESAHN